MKTSSPAVPLALSAGDLGRLLGVSPKTVWSMSVAGTIGPQPLRISPRVARWDAEEIRQWWRLQVELGRPVRRPEWLARREEGRT